MAKNHIIVGLDIGSATIKLLAAQPDRDLKKFEALAFFEAPSSGIRKGVVINPQEVQEIVSKLIEKAEGQINKKINSLYVNVGGGHIFSLSSRGLVSVSRADQKISQEDVNRVLQAAETISLLPNREILDVFRKEFIVDGEGGLKEVLGLQGVRLEADVLLVGGFIPYLKNLSNVLADPLLPKVEEFVVSPLAASEAVLKPREKELGVVLLDIGAGTTGIAVFEEKDLIHLNIIPIGSAHITNDIAIGLKTDIDVAERLKLEFGTLLFKGKDKKERLKLGNDEILVFSRKQLAKIIELRVSEIFGEVNKELKKISKEKSLPAGVVLTGGGSMLPQIAEMAKKEFRLSCRLGSCHRFSSLKADPRLSVVCGLVLKGLNKGENRWEEGFSGFKSKIFQKVKNFFRIFIP